MKRRTLSIFIFGCLLLAGSAGYAQQKDEESGKRWAICIGVNSYTDNTSFSPLKYAAKDALAMADIFNKQGYTVLCFVTEEKNGTGLKPEHNSYPKKATIEGTLNNNLKYRIKPNDFVVFFFSGHGMNDSTGNGYLVPSDATGTNLFGTAIAESTITNFIKTLKVKRSLLMIDACRNVPETGKSATENRPPYHPKFEDANVVLYAAEKGKKSDEDAASQHGVFTRYALAALMGEGDVDSNRVVTLTELYKFVKEGLEDWSDAKHRADPQRPAIDYADNQYGNWELAVIKAPSKWRRAGRGLFFLGTGQRYAGYTRKSALITLSQIAAAGGAVYANQKVMSARNDYNAVRKAYEETGPNDQSFFDQKYRKVTKAHDSEVMAVNWRTGAVGSFAALYLYSRIDAAFITPKLDKKQQRVSLEIQPSGSSGLMAIARF